jgi:hypothetical protein
MITADQLLAHAIGDYVLQSDWMANEKTKRSVAALVHVLTYAIPFLFLRPSWLALLVIISTHFVIDRWRLARYVVWAKNFIAPRRRLVGQLDTGPKGNDRIRSWVGYARNLPWRESDLTGYPCDTPAWLAVWLMIIADNIMHVFINGLALKYL